jgi:CelD/BcsL family acetyltransferase involved in cellulose biosynthesis
LGSSTRYHIRRRLRDCEKHGVTVERYSQPADVAARFSTLVRLHLARWRKDNLPGTFGRPGFVQCLNDVFLNPPSGASYHLYELQRDGDTFASLLTFHYGDSALYYQAGWDPAADLSSLSPGVVLMAHSIRHAIDSGLRYYEFLRGDEQYKSRWTKTYRKTVSFLLARRPAGRSYLHVAQLKDFVKSHVRGSKAPTSLTEQCAE